MKPWRERIAEARNRGSFAHQDMMDWGEPMLCYVGEQRQRYDLWFDLEMTQIDTGDSACGPLQDVIQMAIRQNDFDQAERLLDEVEDRALLLKRDPALKLLPYMSQTHVDNQNGEGSRTNG